MRVVTLLDNVSASVQTISDFVNLDQRTQWQLFITSTGLDGTPKLFIEEAHTRGTCHPPTQWRVYNVKCSNVDGSFDINDNEILIERGDFKSNWIRVRLEANDNTTGSTTVEFTYKTFV